MAYVYRHIRLDKNEPFYIGIGSDEKYHRAGDKSTRNNIWKKIVKKTNYEIEILLDGLSIEEAKQKEIEFISLYGRIVDNSGTLCNLTLGGDGTTGHIVTKETAHKISMAQKGRKFSKEHIEKIRKARTGCKMPKRTPEHQAKLNAHRINVPRTEETKMKLSLANMGKISPRRRPILQYSLNGDFIKKYEYILDAATEIGGTHSNICKCASGKGKSAYGFIWVYENNKL
jgi:hypothetical protein